jgi:hypothetical protein
MTLNHRGQDTRARPWMHGVEDMRENARRGTATYAFSDRGMSEQEAVEMQRMHGVSTVDPLLDDGVEDYGDAADQWLSVNDTRDNPYIGGRMPDPRVDKKY